MSEDNLSFFAEVPLLDSLMPSKEGTRRAVVVLTLRYMETLPSTTLKWLARYNQELKGSGNLLLLAGVGLVALALLGGRLLVRHERAERSAAERRRYESLARAGAGLAHQLRTPIATIKGSCQLLLEDCPPERRRRLGTVLEETERDIVNWPGADREGALYAAGPSPGGEPRERLRFPDGRPAGSGRGAAVRAGSGGSTR